jgi:hypothetical protein
MAAPSNNNGPAPRPVRIPPLSTIIAEGNLEIGRQVREAVERAVTAGIAVDPARLRIWGLSGAEYFAKKLRERIMPPAQDVRPKPGGSTPDENAVPADAGSPTNAPGIGEPLPAELMDPPRRPFPVITTKMDWMHQERDRWSIARRSIARGLLIAVSLLSLTVFVLRMWF